MIPAIFEKVKVDRKSCVPRHYQVKQIIKEAISSGVFKKGDLLPPERKLCELLQVSRITIRRALSDLEHENIIERTWGKGNVVLNVPEIENKIKKIAITIWAKETPYHPATIEILKGFAEGLKNTIYSPEIIFIDDKQISSGAYLQQLNPQVVECAVVSVQELPEEQIQAIAKKIPKTIFCNVKNVESHILIDFAGASFEITSYLIELGHKDIALLNGPAEFQIPQMVLNGYIQAHDQACLGFSKDLIKNSYYSSEDGYNLTKQLFQQDIIPTAIIAGDDFMALGVLKAIKEKGLRCPEDISVISFNNFPFCEFTDPPLTSYHIDFFNFGKVMAQQALNLIYERETNQVVLRGRLVIRKSAGKVNGDNRPDLKGQEPGSDDIEKKRKRR
ncbi:MAG: GntR family transcriptional regulator [Candidatus Omnitrophica bacterium]|nr:GntR family transcriptional regulator [Candidatus Omnitrophota bacterium]